MLSKWPPHAKVNLLYVLLKNITGKAKNGLFSPNLRLSSYKNIKNSDENQTSFPWGDFFFFFHQNGRTKPLVHKSHFLKSKYVALDKGELGWQDVVFRALFSLFWKPFLTFLSGMGYMSLEYQSEGYPTVNLLISCIRFQIPGQWCWRCICKGRNFFYLFC